MATMKYAVNVWNRGSVIESIPVFGFTPNIPNGDIWRSRSVKSINEIKDILDMIDGARIFSMIIPLEKANQYFQIQNSIEELRFSMTTLDTFLIPTSGGKLVFFPQGVFSITNVSVIDVKSVAENKFLPKLITMNLYNYLALQAPENNRSKWLKPAMVTLSLTDSSTEKISN